MPSPDYQSLPDVVVGRHPDLGIVATSPKHLAADALLKGAGFRPVSGRPDLYALADQGHDGNDRASRAVAALREAHYKVDADDALAPWQTSRAGGSPDQPPRIDPDIAFAEHPELGIVAATSDLCTVRGRQLLEEHGWRQHPSLDIHTLPPAIGRREALDNVAHAVLAMHRTGLQVAAQPTLARDVSKRHATEPSTTARLAQGVQPTSFGLPGKPPAAAPAPSPVDPRIAFSRSR
ncbi:hypothetical protein [Actinacidiphila acididurans]|uniref:Uncharacterized protein n=1 Tax=Actinacidiphila acididurans TaxID=2784346 RepID=A0ABS2TY42_9ACTN|nr:hypothetical protein [Actinacidiphila acididurans]MBM9508002.1 hypothetical protein [Actinacidiphila acididurans]